MARKKIYLIKKDVQKAGEERYEQITGMEFYAFVSNNTADEEKKYFIRLVDERPEGEDILVQTSKDEYDQWKKEYAAHRYRQKKESQFQHISLDAEGKPEAAAVAGAETTPEDHVLLREEREILIHALQSLSPAERELIEMLYLWEPAKTLREAAAYYRVSVSTIHKRKEAILKKMRTFW